MSGIHDRELLDVLGALDPEIYSGKAWRTTWKGRDPLMGGWGGGRWSPPNDFEALYTSLEKDISLAELYFHLSKAPIFSSSAVVICRLLVNRVSVLKLTDENLLHKLGIEDATVNMIDYSRTREIGAAAYFLEYQGIFVPSARREGINLVLFPDHLDVKSSLIIEDKKDINWPAWIERQHH